MSKIWRILCRLAELLFTVHLCTGSVFPHLHINMVQLEEVQDEDNVKLEVKEFEDDEEYTDTGMPFVQPPFFAPADPSKSPKYQTTKTMARYKSRLLASASTP